MTERKGRPHDIKDRIKFETQNIEPIHVDRPAGDSTTINKKLVKHMKKQASQRAHEYEFSPSIERNKGVGAKQQRAIQQKVSLQQHNREQR